MKCPVDQTDMLVVESRSIELDFCPLCSGVWFDSQELELLISADSGESPQEPGNDFLTPQPAKVSESRRKCPICNNKMDKVWLGNEPKVLIDSCPKGDGLWFDGGELHEIIHQIQSQGENDILSFLSETFKARHAADSHG